MLPCFLVENHIFDQSDVKLLPFLSVDEPHESSLGKEGRTLVARLNPSRSGGSKYRDSSSSGVMVAILIRMISGTGHPYLRSTYGSLTYPSRLANALGSRITLCPWYNLCCTPLRDE
jgi:hypothetical protein